jgi:hypothetical protein
MCFLLGCSASRRCIEALLQEAGRAISAQLGFQDSISTSNCAQSVKT